MPRANPLANLHLLKQQMSGADPSRRPQRVARHWLNDETPGLCVQAMMANHSIFIVLLNDWRFWPLKIPANLWHLRSLNPPKKLHFGARNALSLRTTCFLPTLFNRKNRGALPTWVGGRAVVARSIGRPSSPTWASGLPMETGSSGMASVQNTMGFPRKTCFWKSKTTRLGFQILAYGFRMLVSDPGTWLASSC